MKLLFSPSRPGSLATMEEEEEAPPPVEIEVFHYLSQSSERIKQAVIDMNPVQPLNDLLEARDDWKQQFRKTLIWTLLNCQACEFLANTILTKANEKPQALFDRQFDKAALEEELLPEKTNLDTVGLTFPNWDIISSHDPFERDDLYSIFRSLWYSAVYYYEVFDLLLRPLSEYKDIVSGDDHLCDYIDELFDDLRPTRDRTQRLIQTFYEMLVSLSSGQSREDCTLPSVEERQNIYAEMIVALRFTTDPEAPLQILDERLRSDFENGSLNIRTVRKRLGKAFKCPKPPS
jgi:hypothetical protein